jgi:hypothetical protein
MIVLSRFGKVNPYSSDHVQARLSVFVENQPPPALGFFDVFLEFFQALPAFPLWQPVQQVNWDYCTINVRGIACVVEPEVAVTLSV